MPVPFSHPLNPSMIACGLSHAAKCPPSSYSFSHTTGPRVRAQIIGISCSSFGNHPKPNGTGIHVLMSWSLKPGWTCCAS